MGTNGTHDPNQRPSESTVIETEAPEKESQGGILDQLLAKVDMAAPLEIPMDSGQILTITQEQFIEYYLPPDASRAEKAKCFNEARAAGVNPAIRGDCHFFKTGGGPLGLFVGYHVYVRKAYANGLNHIHKPELVYDDETGQLDSCIITLEIEGRPNFIWETWLSEVVSEKSTGIPNARWVKAERQMLIKCSVINTFRMAGIASIGILPPTREEMPDFPAPGFKNLTQEHLDEYDVEADSEATLGKVNADYHKPIDEWRKAYHATWKDEEIFADDDERHAWELAIFDKPSSADFEIPEYRQAFKEFDSGRAAAWVQEYRANQPKSEPDPPTTGGDPNLDNLPDVPEKHAEEEQPEQSIQERLFLSEASTRFATPKKRDAWCLAIFDPPKPREEWSESEYVLATKEMFPLAELYPQNAPENAEDDDSGTTQGEPAEEQEQGEEHPEWDVTQKTRKRIGELATELEIYGNVRSQTFKERIKPLLGGRWLLKMQAMTEVEGQNIVASLGVELAAQANDDPADSEDELLEDGALAPEAAKAEAMSQAVAATEREAERVAAGEPRFQTTPAWADLNRLYNNRLFVHFQINDAPAFESPEVHLDWLQKTTGAAGMGDCLPEHFALANTGLDAMGIAQADAETPQQTGSEPAATEDLANGDNVKAGGEQREEIRGLLAKLLPGAVDTKTGESNAEMTAQARGWISEAINSRSPGINHLTANGAVLTIKYLTNKIAERKATTV